MQQGGCSLPKELWGQRRFIPGFLSQNKQLNHVSRTHRPKAEGIQHSQGEFEKFSSNFMG